MRSLGYYIVYFLLYRVFFYYIVYFLLQRVFFIRLFNSPISVSDYMASNIRLAGELEAMNLYTNLLHPTFS